jgi:hypothetical protein
MSKKKKPNLNPARNMDIDAWRERQIIKWTKQLIEERNQAFSKAHDKDTDEELREYVRRRAAALGYTPHPLELPGGLYIQERLGDWDVLAAQLGLKPVGQSRGRIAFSRLRKQGEARFTQERKAKRMFKALTKDQQKQIRLEERQKNNDGTA